MKNFLVVIVIASLINGCGGGSSSTSAPISPQPLNNNPVINGIESPDSLGENQTSLIKVNFSDADANDSHSFNWSTNSQLVTIENATLKEATLNVADLAFDKGEIDIEVAVTVSDGTFTTNKYKKIITLVPAIEKPQIAIESPPNINALETIILSADASDSDGEISKYIWLQTVGEPIDFQGQGSNLITFKAPFMLQDESFTFELTVEDSEGETSQKITTFDVKKGTIGHSYSNTYQYDKLGRVITVTKNKGDTPFKAFYKYDQAGNLESIKN